MHKQLSTNNIFSLLQQGAIKIPNTHPEKQRESFYGTSYNKFESKGLTVHFLFTTPPNSKSVPPKLREREHTSQHIFPNFRYRTQQNRLQASKFSSTVKNSDCDSRHVSSSPISFKCAKQFGKIKPEKIELLLRLRTIHPTLSCEFLLQQDGAPISYEPGYY